MNVTVPGSSLTRTPEAEVFKTTLWTVVLRAAHPSEEGAAEALETLFQIYWKPVNRYIRRWCPDWHRAEDLTQGFFLQLLNRDFLKFVHKERGKFRSFLLAAANNFLIDERRREGAAKRGGGVAPLSLDEEPEDGRAPLQVSSGVDPDKEFLRDWCHALFARVFSRLENEFAASGKLEVYHAIKPCLMGEQEEGYAEIGAKLGKSEGGIKQEVRRLRDDFGRIFRDEVSQTVTTPDQFEEEVGALLAAIG